MEQGQQECTPPKESSNSTLENPRALVVTSDLPSPEISEFRCNVSTPTYISVRKSMCIKRMWAVAKPIAYFGLIGRVLLGINELHW